MSNHKHKERGSRDSTHSLPAKDSLPPDVPAHPHWGMLIARTALEKASEYIELNKPRRGPKVKIRTVAVKLLIRSHGADVPLKTIAEALGVSRTTLLRWYKDNNFKTWSEVRKHFSRKHL